jgi:gluconate 5-dehydrogenase
VHYTASKHGIIGLTKKGAVKYGQFGIRVNCIAPGAFPETRLTERTGLTRSEQQLQAIAQITPLRRNSTLDEIKAACLYYASDASSFATGTVLI